MALALAAIASGCSSGKFESSAEAEKACNKWVEEIADGDWSDSMDGRYKTSWGGIWDIRYCRKDLETRQFLGHETRLGGGIIPRNTVVRSNTKGLPVEVVVAARFRY